MQEIIDTHAHLNDPAFNGDIEKVLARMEKAGVTGVINVGYDVNSSRRSVEQAHKWSPVYAAVGMHPHDAKDFDDEAAAIISGLAHDSRVAAVGETGLDYYRNLSPRDVQKKVFLWHLDLSRQLRLPVIVHDRDAHDDTVRILKQTKPHLAGGVMHCFSGSWEIARECLELGFYISFAGPVTYKNARKLQAVAARIPLDRLLVETDSPYLTPEPYRGKRNEPAYVYNVIEVIAVIRNMTVEEVKAATTANARLLFGI